MSTQSKRKSYTEIFLEIAKPDSDGFTDEITMDKLVAAGIPPSGNGGSWCRDSGALGRKYNIQRIKKKNRIVAVKLNGFNKNPIGKTIPAKISKEIKSQRCVVLGTSNSECDHKDGRLDDPVYNTPEKLTTAHFQPLSKAANNAKRQFCKACRETDKRFDATILGFAVGQWKGNGEYRGTCIGCFWYDPLRFKQEISKSLKT